MPAAAGALPRPTSACGFQRVGKPLHRDHFHALVAAALRRVRLRHDRALETVRGSFLQALFSVGARPDLAAETNFTEGHGLARKSVVSGTSVSVRVDLWGRGYIKNNNK